MDNREMILETALDLFYARGYDAVGVREIAERSGVTKPTLYYYFKSKYGLLEQLLEGRGEAFMERLHRACSYEGDLRNTLCAAAGELVSFAEQEPKFYALFLALCNSARENEAYQAVRPLVLRLQQEVEQIFVSAAGLLGNMRGRQRQFSLGFIGLILFDIKMRLEISDDLSLTVSREEINSLVHQFMHGIYS